MRNVQIIFKCNYYHINIVAVACHENISAFRYEVLLTIHGNKDQ